MCFVQLQAQVLQAQVQQGWGALALDSRVPP